MDFGFRQGRGTSTVIIEAKFRMQLAKRTFIFMDLKKSYDTMDRGTTVEGLKGYGVGPNKM
jgi:hypothetical protein